MVMLKAGVFGSAIAGARDGDKVTAYAAVLEEAGVPREWTAKTCGVRPLLWQHGQHGFLDGELEQWIRDNLDLLVEIQRIEADRDRPVRERLEDVMVLISEGLEMEVGVE